MISVVKARRTRENIVAEPAPKELRAEQKPVFYMYCEWCDRPMDKAWLTVWRETQYGLPIDVHFIHHGCREQFEAAHKGKWFRLEMRPAMTW